MSETRRALLDALADGPVAGPAFAETHGVSRAAVWKWIDRFREEGFDIDSIDEGYAVRSVPTFGRSAVEFGLDAPYRVDYHETVGSTNDRARDLAGRGGGRADTGSAGDDREVVVLADEQTGSRGRLDREWTAPSGGVWASLLLRPERPPAHVPLFTLAAAVATTSACREAGVDARIKWPNDVLVPDSTVADDDRGGAKLAGILTEMEGEANRVSWLVVGIGVNANVDRESLPPGATSIRAETGDVDRRLFVQRLLERFHELREDPESVLPAWRDSSATLGRRVRVETPGGVVEGEAVDVTFPGALVVRTGSGERTVHAGDCEHLRTAG
jgi:BirA family biotin operon repressor/biotin-[acetyl-CoA-carboxylase] ligase